MAQCTVVGRPRAIGSMRARGPSPATEGDNYEPRAWVSRPGDRRPARPGGHGAAGERRRDPGEPGQRRLQHHLALAPPTRAAAHVHDDWWRGHVFGEQRDARRIDGRKYGGRYLAHHDYAVVHDHGPGDDQRDGLEPDLLGRG